jgi:glyoxylase-like metal-dependent hydrolase (beta-lactamase superfamily II)
VVVAGVDVLTVHCPGHTAGTSCFLVNRNEPPLLFTGDQLFAAGGGRCDLAGGCAQTMERSLQQRVLTLDDDVVVCPGHGEATTIAHARRLAATS